jgi:multidrug efflux pump
MNRFLAAFVKKPILAVVVSLVILIVGWRAAEQLPIQQYPNIQSASVIITTVYVGASAEVVRGFITTPIERAVASVTGLDYVESASIPSVSTVTARLKLNQDVNVALTEVGSKLDQIRSELPAEAEPPSVDVQRADRPYATFYISFLSEQMTRAQVTEYITRNIQPALATVPGVQRAGIEGGTALAMRIWLDTDRMAALGVGATEVQQALRNNNYLAAIGRTEGQSVQIDLLANTDLRTPAEFEQLVIRRQGGALIRLRDLARVELGAEEAAAEARESGKPAVFVSVWPSPGVNEIDVSKALNKRLDEIRPSLPAGMQMVIGYDGTMYMQAALKAIVTTLAETVAIVALIVFLFMGSLRSALVPLVAIPLSLVGAAAFMYLLGFSLNLLTLLAIVLSVGLVVDDAIVVVENVQRLVDGGKGRIEAALASAKQLFSPIVSMTITLAAVYAPIGFLSGLTGVLFKEFAFTLAIAVIMSGVVALTLSPVMSARFVREPGERSRLAEAVERRFAAVKKWYAGMLDATLANRSAVIAAGTGLVLLIAPLFLLSPRELAPVEDQSEVGFFIESAPDASLGYTTREANQVIDSMLRLPEAAFTWEVALPSQGFGGLLLKDYDERERTPQELLPELYGAFAAVPGVRAFPSVAAALPGAGQFDVEVVITSTDSAEQMEPVARQIVKAANEAGVFLYADTDLKIDVSQARVELDRDRVADLGLDLAQVGSDLGALLGGNYVNRFNLDGRSYKVIPQVGEAEREAAERLLDLKVTGPNGSLIPVSTFARIESGAAPRSLNRFQQRNSFKVYGAVYPNLTKEQGLVAMEKAARAASPAGYGIDYAGESRQIRTEGNTLTGTLAFALLLIYLVLTAQFGNFRDPLVILLASVPLALSGALIFTFMEFTTINIFTQVGLITLVGLIAKNGILIVEFANKLQEAGWRKLTAIREASLERLRPVLMTTAATVFGHFPLVLVTGPGAEARNSIGIVLVAGMAIGTLFTLLILPSVYMWLAKEHPVDAAAVEAGDAPGHLALPPAPAESQGVAS